MANEIEFLYPLSIADHDRLPSGKEEKQPLYLPDYNLAFTFAIQDLKIAWVWYRRAYEEELKV